MENLTIPVAVKVNLDELKSIVIDEALDLRIRRIVRDELREMLPDLQQAIRQDVMAHLTAEIRKRSFA